MGRAENATISDLRGQLAEARREVKEVKASRSETEHGTRILIEKHNVARLELLQARREVEALRRQVASLTEKNANLRHAHSDMAAGRGWFGKTPGDWHEEVERLKRVRAILVDAAQGLLNTQPQYPTRLQWEGIQYGEEAIAEAKASLGANGSLALADTQVERLKRELGRYRECLDAYLTCDGSRGVYDGLALLAAREKAEALLAEEGHDS